MCVCHRVSGVSVVYMSTDAFVLLQWTGLDTGPFQVQRSLSSCLEVLPRPNEQPGVRVTSVISHGALLFPICYHQPLRNNNLQLKCNRLR